MVLKSNMDVYDSAILLVRNPYKAHIAEYNRKKTSDKLGYANADDFFSKGNANLALFCYLYRGGTNLPTPPLSYFNIAPKLKKSFALMHPDF